MLTLRAPGDGDEDVARAAQATMQAEGFDFGFLDPRERWPEYLARLERERRGIDLPPGRVPATFRYADVDGQVVGRASVRHALNERLLRIGGHIGYAVLPPFRRRGYGTAILRRSLVLARAAGVGRVLVTCDDDNLGSIAVIERCGGARDAGWPATTAPAATGSPDAHARRPGRRDGGGRPPPPAPRARRSPRAAGGVGRHGERRVPRLDDDTWRRGAAWALAQALVALPYYRRTNAHMTASARHAIRAVLADEFGVGGRSSLP